MARSPCPHITVSAPRGELGFVECTELGVDGAGQVPGPVLAGLADVDDRPVDRFGGGERDRVERVAGGGPGVDPSVELAEELFEADVAGLADQLAAVLVGVEDEHERGVGRSEPPQPGAELGSQGVGHRARDVTGGVGGDRTGVHEPAAAAGEARHVVGLEPRQAGLGRAVEAGAGPVHVAQT